MTNENAEQISIKFGNKALPHYTILVYSIRTMFYLQR